MEERICVDAPATTLIKRKLIDELVINYKVTFSPTDPGRPSSPLSPWW